MMIMSMIIIICWIHPIAIRRIKGLIELVIHI